jgi:5-methylcytosine-specific restriction endonuclease McrA
VSQAWEGGSTRAWRRIRAAVLLRDGGTCQLQHPGCTTTATHAAHTVPKSRGGRDVMTNLKAACAHCNLSEGADFGDPPPRPVTNW